MRRNQVPASTCRPVRGLGVAAMLAATIAAPASAQYTLDWFTIDGGGAMQATGGPFTMSGTIGQPDAGLLSGANYQLGGGFWRGGGTWAVGVEENVDVSVAAPLAFQIHPAAPNPFVQTTLIGFDLPEPRVVSARVYDVTGRLTRTLVQGSLPAGRHKRAWDGTNDSGDRVGTGVYFVVLGAGVDRAKQKIVVLR